MDINQHLTNDDKIFLKRYIRGYTDCIDPSLNFADIIRKAIDNGANVHDYSLIKYAALNGHYAVIDLLVSRGVNLMAGSPPVIVSCAEQGMYDMMKFLHDRGATINTNGGMLLFNAIKAGDEKKVETFINIGANVRIDNGKMMMMAITCNRPNIVRMLIDSGFPINDADPLDICYAISHRYNNVLRVLIDGGITINHYYQETVRQSITHGCDCFTRYLLGENKPIWISALKRSAECSPLDIFKLILERYEGMRDYRKTIKEAARCGHSDVLWFLLKSGADAQYGMDKMMKQTDAPNTYKIMMLVRFGAWHGSLNPYDYLTHLNMNHVKHLGKYPDIITMILRKQRRISGFEDILVAVL